MATKERSTRTGKAPRNQGRSKRVSDDAQRSLIVQAARQLFVESGYGRTTIDDVAAQCQISKPTVDRLFPGKAALFAAVVDAERRSLLALPGDHDAMPIELALQQIFQVDLDPQRDMERTAWLRLVKLESRQHPDLEEVLQEKGADKFRADLAAWLRRQCDRGLIQLDDADSAARILLNMMFGAGDLLAGDHPAGASGEQRRVHIQTCVTIFLNGFATR